MLKVRGLAESLPSVCECVCVCVCSICLPVYLSLYLHLYTHTPDNIVRNDHKKITDYFNHFLAHDEIVANFPEVTEESVIRMGKRSRTSNLLALIRGVAVALYCRFTALLPLKSVIRMGKRSRSRAAPEP